MNEVFRKFAVYVSRFVGSIWAFLTFILLLLITGYLYNFSTAWENNLTFFVSISTLLILFFLQRSQNHNDSATHLKLDELIRASERARNEVASIEQQTEKDIETLKNEVPDEPQ
jgi:low affinity Fe/Cu permease